MKKRVARLVLVSLLAIGLAAGFLPLTTQPAKALEKFSLLGTNGSPTGFWGFDALSNSFSGSYRQGKAPFTVIAASSGISWTGSYPITFSFVWGDGSANVSSQACSSCSVSPLIGGIVLPGVGVGMAMHTYNAAGTYTAFVNVSDSAGVFRSDGYHVNVFSASPSSFGWRVFIEGQGLVANLSRQTYLAQPIMAFLYKNGSSPMIGEWSATWYMDTWSNPIYTQSFTKTVLPDEYFPFFWPGNIPQVITAPGTHQFWVKTSCVGCSGFGANVSSPKMTVVYTASTVIPSMTISQVSGTITNLQPNQVALVRYHITNPSSFTIAWFDQIVNTGALTVVPEPANLFNQYGPVINGTIQTYIVQQFVTSGTPVLTDEGNFPITNLGYLLQPGQDVIITQEITAISTINLATTSPVSYQFTPYAAASCTSATSSLSASCGIGGNPVTATTSITTGGPAPASITTLYGQQIGNGSVVFAGAVNSMGTSTLMQVWFSFTVPNGTTYLTPQHLITAVTTVQDYEQGLPVGNYSLTMLATTSIGQSLNGGTVTFTVGLSIPSNNPTANSQGFTQSMLFAFASLSGVPAVIFGAIVGFGLILTGVMFFIFLDIREPTFLMLWLLVAVVINVWLFLWPSIVLLLIIVPEGILLYEKFTGGSSGGEASG